LRGAVSIATTSPATISGANPDPGVRRRLDAVDLLRGIVMIMMALDHVRDHFSNAAVDPTDLAHTTPALFLTRWVTHFCAPTFVLLAGVSAFLAGRRGRTTRELSRFLLTRGIWLVVLEATVVGMGWSFDPHFGWPALQVIWAIGVSMIVLSGLVFLPTPAIAGFGIALIAGHNLLDGIAPERFGAAAWLWSVLHVPRFPVIYPLVPWVGVMAVGYGLGPLLLREATERRRILVRLGLGLTAAFVILRLANVYGDPAPWSRQEREGFTILSFLDTTKYPPSLLFLLMTLGPAIAALPALERLSGPAARVILVYGRVPLFFYVLHLYLIHALAVAAAYLAGRDIAAFMTACFAFPKDWGFGLPVVYMTWILVVALLYAPCRWFGGVKQRRRDPWLSYL
jgi:uncharacterized membrane protein